MSRASLVARRPRTKPAEIRAAEIMDAAQGLFLRKGIASTSIDEIVAAADVAKGTFYLYFETKEHLLATLRQRFVGGLRDELQKAMGRRAEDDWTGRLDAWVARAVTLHFERLALHDVVFHDFRPEDRRTKNDGNHAIDHLAAFLERGAQAGAWSVADPRLLAVMLFHAFHGAVDEVPAGAPAASRAKLVRVLTAFFRRAVEPTGPRET